MKAKAIDLTFDRFLHFLTKIEDYSDSNKCWAWNGRINDKGYGVFDVDRSVLRAHRISYTVLIGIIPENLQLDHLCRNRRCVNPWHAEPVTNKENANRGDCGLHNAIKTHCPHGHEYDSKNTHVDKLGIRRCRSCHREACRRSRERMQYVFSEDYSKTL